MNSSGLKHTHYTRQPLLGVSHPVASCSASCLEVNVLGALTCAATISTGLSMPKGSCA